MTKKYFFNGLLVIMLMFGMMVFGDGFDIPNPAFNGTWVVNNFPEEIVMNNGIYEYFLTEYSFDYIVSGYLEKGTYTTSGNNIFFQATHFKGFSTKSGTFKFTLWYEINKIVPYLNDAMNEIEAEYNSMDFLEALSVYSAKVDGNTITNSRGTIYIKK
jgi:hypothetical protein